MPEAPRVPDQPWRVLMTAPVTGLAPVEVVVASLDPSRELSDVAPIQGLTASVATVESLVPEAALRDLDPLDALEDAGFDYGAFETENGTSMESAASEPAEVEVATLSTVVPDSPRVEAGAHFAGMANLPPVLDPLDALKDAEFESSAFETENGSAIESAASEPAEVEVAALSAVVPDSPRVEAGAPVAIMASLPLVEVANGTGRLEMAARIRDHLEAEGVVAKRLTNAAHYRHQKTIIFYRSGWRSYAEKLARMLPAVIELEGRDEQESDILLELGGDLLEFDRGLYYAAKRHNGTHPG